MNRHTPGPWHTRPSHNEVGSEQYGICRVYEKRYRSEVEANINLIAAAPELLETLESIVAEADRYAARTGKIVTWASDVRGLINKAKGVTDNG